MLKCIPELIRFPEIEDSSHQEDIMAATVILRQCEEMEEELEEGEVENRLNGRVNFLAITHTIIDTMISTPLDHSLATATFWIAARQDVYVRTYSSLNSTTKPCYMKSSPNLKFGWDWLATLFDSNKIQYALTRQRAPEFRFLLESYNTSPANTMIIFASEVAKWRWGTKEPREWGKSAQPRLKISAANN